MLFLNPAGTDEVRNSAYVQFEHGQTVKTRIAKPGVRLRATAPARPLHDPIVFRLEVTNTGPAIAKDVVVTDELPDGLQFIDGKPAPKPEKPLTWKLGDLAPGQSRSVEYQAISKQTGTFRNKAEVKAAGGVQQKASASVTVGEAKLSLLKTGPRQRLVNRPTPYQITVSNPGTIPATGVQVSDELPSGIELLSASAGNRVANGQVRWSLGTLPPGAQHTLQVVIRARVPDASATWRRPRPSTICPPRRWRRRTSSRPPERRSRSTRAPIRSTWAKKPLTRSALSIWRRPPFSVRVWSSPSPRK